MAHAAQLGAQEHVEPQVQADDTQETFKRCKITAAGDIDGQSNLTTVLPTAYAFSRDNELQRAAADWAAPTDFSIIPRATDVEIPVLDLGPYFSSGSVASLEAVAASLRSAAMSTGFLCIVNHGVDPWLVAETFEAAQRFHALDDAIKHALAMDAKPSRNGQVRAGCGYLGPANRKLPARSKANMNAAFVVKREVGPRNITLDKMPWPEEQSHLDGFPFRQVVTRYCETMEALASRMLPIFAVALGLAPNHFSEAFETPLYRLRLSCYAATPPGEYGINPHVDTSFFTILATSAAGLVVQSRAQAAAGGVGWVRAPHRADSFVVNFGELLSQVTNDSWPATRHYAIFAAEAATEKKTGDCNGSCANRFSLPFFFNATPTHRMAVVPTCTSIDNPPKYPPLSYLEGQGVVQGE
mmetsp:Transcript_112697/g.224173  ORF Transcript_112697/g.224173 Transcript_112697/m.224173 type:complete len:412 (+) Transcript_112697:68-1303(+)